MMKLNLLIIFTLCALSVYPATSISRWFSSTYYDLRVTLRRYGHCSGDLPPLRDQSFNETEFLVHQMRVFLDQANYDNEQLANISLLMSSICRSDSDSIYPISVNIDSNFYSNNTGKRNRCRAIDEAMDAMYGVFRRAALNRSEPLDFSVIQFYPNPADREASYNLTDLINISWIRSETDVEDVCKLTNSVKEYVQTRTSNSTAQDRSQQQPGGMMNALIEMIDRILEPLLGIQKRLYWEGNNRLEQSYSLITNQLMNLRDGLGNRYRSARERIAGVFTSSPSTNSTVPVATNGTNVAPSTNSTTTQPPLVVGEVVGFNRTAVV